MTKPANGRANTNHGISLRKEVAIDKACPKALLMTPIIPPVTTANKNHFINYTKTRISKLPDWLKSIIQERNTE